jgi:hypothetical protein
MASCFSTGSYFYSSLPYYFIRREFMSKSAFSVKIFGIYKMLLGPTLILFPNLLLSVFGVAPTNEVWIRVIGVLAFNVGVYYWVAAKCEAKAFFISTVVSRALVLLALVSFAALGLMSPIIILVGCVDFAGGIWTWTALRSERAVL